MTWSLTLLIAIGLAMDAFSVAIGVGASLPRLTGRHLFRLSWHFGLFQFLMPIIGWLAGTTIIERIAFWGHWIGFFLLCFIGVRMIVEALRASPLAVENSDPTRGLSLVTLSVATSLDALAVGVSLAAIGVEIFYPSLIIGIVAGTLTLAGMSAGRWLGRSFGQRVGVVGGLVLIGVGLKVLFHFC